MRRLIVILTLFMALVAAMSPAIKAKAQDRPSAILVLDASGSMWGQIDGKAKIVIARDVIKGLLHSLPPDMKLGLTVYGHRRKGDCSDIETMIAPGTDRDAIASAIESVSPRGKTPLSAAVLQAADALRYQEEPATVILISDGRETCHLDPCAVGRQLEATGVDFTAHVIGFDVADADVRAQLACLADETGGTFRNAADAAELADALKVVTAPPVVVPVDISFRATAGDGGAQISDGLDWVLNSGDEVIDTLSQPAFSRALDPGTYQVSVTRASDGETVHSDFTVSDTPLEITLALPEPAPNVVLSAPVSAPAGTVISVGWTSFDGAGTYDQIVLRRVGGDRDIVAVGTGFADRQKTDMQLPATPGKYELTYQREEGRGIVGRAAISVLPPTLRLSAPTSAPGGTLIDISWQGEGYRAAYDSIAILRDGQDGAVSGVAVINTSDQQATLQVPAQPGAYRIAYIIELGQAVIASQPLSVSAPQVGLRAPDHAPAGSVIQIGWDNPAYRAAYDRIAIVRRGEGQSLAESRVINTSDRHVQMQVPPTPGEYDLIYGIEINASVISRIPLTIEPASLTLDAPTTVAAGADFPVHWGPAGYTNGYDRITLETASGNEQLGEAYVLNSSDNNVTLHAPAEPGDYNIAYVTELGGAKLVVRRLTVTAP